MEWENIRFTSFDDFYINKKFIRNYYKGLSMPDKWSYKHYVYYCLKFCESDKNAIWNFLNENENCRKDLIDRYNLKMSRKDKKRK